jgi:hypothetical protein
MGKEERFVSTLGRTVAACAFLAIGCGGASIPRASLPEVPTELARCRVAASAGSPLVTEWAATEKANLEARIREGGVAVAYSGCSMRIIPDCKLGGSYVWQRTTPATDRLVINNTDELYAKLPLGAASLEGELQRSGELVVQTTVSGQMRASGISANDVPLGGACAAATHLVSGVAVGAFELSAGGKLSAGASAKVAVVEDSGVKTLSEKSLVRKAGDPDRCAESTWDYPAADCNSPIQLFLTPLPGRAAAEGPPGTVRVDFVASDAESTWDVRSGKEVLCTTPCVRWVDPARPLAMRRKGAGWFTRLIKHHRVTISRLDKHAAAGPLQVRADGGSMGRWLGGVTLTTLGAELILAGLLVGVMECGSDEEHDNCGLGLGLLGFGVAATIPGIWLWRGSGPNARVKSRDARSPLYGMHPPVAAPALVVGPGFVAGSF